MKTQDKQILSMLQAFEPEAVFKAFLLYEASYTSPEDLMKKEMDEAGWYLTDEKPEDAEFYMADNDKYWVQTPEGRERDRNIAIEALKEQKRQVQKKSYTGQKMDLNATPISCPSCGNKMYKQSVCSGCADGKKGFKIRLICEDNPDHEVLL